MSETEPAIKYERPIAEVCEIKVGSLWRHYKGGLYQIVSIANHADDSGKAVVVYRDPYKLTEPDWWHYTADFFEIMTVEVPRFELIEDEAATEAASEGNPLEVKLKRRSPEEIRAIYRTGSL